MPKTYLTKQDKLNNHFLKWLIGEMGAKGINQTDLGIPLGITQQAVSYKIKNMAFDYKDLVNLFDYFDSDANDVFKLMRGANK